MISFEPNTPPQSGSHGEPNTVTESINTVDFYVEGHGDTTVRPRRPEVPRFWPADIPLPDMSKPLDKPNDEADS